MPASDFWETPECAFRAFEALTGLNLTVHDLSAPLWPYLPPERFKHRSPCCLAVKTTHDWACMDFEVTRLRRDILDHPDGRCHQCHAGFVEWVVPAMIHGRLAWIFFAGQARGFRPGIQDLRMTSAAKRPSSRLPVFAESRSETILEALRQLRARMLEWHRTAGNSNRLPEPATRAHLIRTFIFDHHAASPSIADLARHVGLSESRTIHLVKECFGTGFSQLLTQMRLKTAASLLRNSSHSVQDICYASGFGDLSHFHRTFSRHFGASPLQYRKTAGP
jgi:AraC-like DNA-binding protein